MKWTSKYKSKVKGQLAALQKSFDRNSIVFNEIVTSEYLHTIDSMAYVPEEFGIGKSWHSAAHNLQKAIESAKWKFKR